MMTNFDETTDFKDPMFDNKIPDFLRDYKLDQKYIIKAEDFKARLKDDPDSMKVMCVCSPDQVNVKIPDIEFSTLSDIKSNIKNLPKDKEIVFVCQLGVKTALLIQFLIENGHDNVRSLEGGVNYLK